jgi:biotin transport system substrate-specific component
MKTKKPPISDLCHMGLFAAMIAVCAQVSIPMLYGVPMTLQTFAVPLAGVALGARKGALAASAYVALGMAGVPVFAGFAGGIGIIFGRTGGFILSFPLMALAAGIGAGKGDLWLGLWLAIGSIANFVCGMLVFSLVTSNSLAVSFVYVVLPFIPTGLAKIFMVMASAKAFAKARNKPLGM